MTDLRLPLYSPPTIAGVQAYNKQSIANFRLENSSELGRMRALTRSDLAGIGSAGLQGAAEDVVDATLINVGTVLRVGTRAALFAPLTAGQDLDILGGAGPLNGLAVRAQAAVHIGPGTGGTPLPQVGTYNQQQWAGFERLTEFQASTTQGLTHADLAHATTALGTGDLVTAAKDVADAAAINVGTGAQIGTRATAFVPVTLGSDLDILGGGSELLSGGIAHK